MFLLYKETFNKPPMQLKHMLQIFLFIHITNVCLVHTDDISGSSCERQTKKKGRELKLIYKQRNAGIWWGTFLPS